MPSVPPGNAEQALVAQAIRGDHTAFGALYDLYLDAIYGFVYYQVSNVQEAEDLTEIVFLKAFEKLPEFRGAKKMENFRAWLYRIARNQVIDFYRTRKPSANLDPDLALPAHDPPPEDLVQLGESTRDLRLALGRLEGLHRQVLLLRFMGELSYSETAAALGLTENYVRVLQYRALRRLRALLAGDEEKEP